MYEDVLYSLLSGIGLGKFCVLFLGIDHSAQKLLVYIARHTGTRERRENIYMGKYQEEVRRSAHKRLSVSWTRNNNVDEAFLFFQLTNQYTVQLDRRWFLSMAKCGIRIIYKTCAHSYTKELLSTGLCTRTWIASPPNIEAYALTRSCSIFAKPNLDYTHWIFAGIVFYMKS